VRLALAAAIVSLSASAVAAKHVTVKTERMLYNQCAAEVLRMPPDTGERYIQQYSTLHMIVDFRTADSATNVVCDKIKGTKITTETDYMF